MNVKSQLSSAALALLLTLGLGACDNNPGPAERAGKALDRSASEAGTQVAAAVEKLGAKVDEQSAKTSVTLTDTEITTKVKASIFAEPGLKTLQIGVDTVNGVVSLSGSVATQADRDRAQGLARAVAGVKAVDNRLALKAN